MEIRVEKYGPKWSLEIIAKNGTEMMTSVTMYNNKRNAVAAARRLAASTLKVVVE